MTDQPSPLFDQHFETHRLNTDGAEIFVRTGGEGPPLLMLHGYPQTHAMWHAIVPRLAEQFTVVLADLRGYGDSSKPESDASHSTYSKRAMARDMVTVMDKLGFENFRLVGHDRGARVTHRLLLDHPHRVMKACVMDIVPTLHMFDTTDQAFATGYYHWFFLIQPNGLPEGLIGRDPDWYLKMKMGNWSAGGAKFDPRAVDEYLRCFRNPDTIHASCEDYRAAAGVDLQHDRQDRNRRIGCPLLVMTGNKGFIHNHYDVLNVWQDYADNVTAAAIDSGHYLPEENPQQTLQHLLPFLNN